MPSDNIYAEKRLPSAFRQSWHHFYGNPISMVGLYGFGALLLLCLFGGLIAPYDIDQQFLGYQLLPPSWSHYGDVSFFLGTDDLGRDVLSRLLSGAGPTVGSAILVTLFATLGALVLGVLAGPTPGIRSGGGDHALATPPPLPPPLPRRDTSRRCGRQGSSPSTDARRGADSGLPAPAPDHLYCARLQSVRPDE